MARLWAGGTAMDETAVVSAHMEFITHRGRQKLITCMVDYLMCDKW